MSHTVKSEKLIKATPAQVYYAWTHAAALTEWLCDFATVAPRPGGRMYLWWHGDFYSAGEYVSLEENKSLTFKWSARLEPAPSEVNVTLQEQDGGTLVTLAHTVPDGGDWKKRAEGFKSEWDATLPNLASVLETGLDRRTYDRPMLGITISDFSPEIARSLGVPVKEGLRLDGTLEAMGAYKAGLRKDDVLVEMAGRPINNDFGSLVLALQGKKGGEQVEVTFYRGPEKKTVTMELTRRPVPEVPWEPAKLAETIRGRYDEALAALEKVFEGVSEAQAELRPAPNEWNAKDVLAHLIHSERGQQAYLDDVVTGYVRVADDFGGNSQAHVRATVAACKSVRVLLDELKRLADETVAYAGLLPAEFIARKSAYLQVANSLLEGTAFHATAHRQQIEAALASGKK